MKILAASAAAVTASANWYCSDCYLFDGWKIHYFWSSGNSKRAPKSII